MPDRPILLDGELPVDLAHLINPLGFTGFDLSWRREQTHWLDPGLVVASTSDFDALILFWNLQAAGHHYASTTQSIPIQTDFQLPTIFAPSVAPNTMSVRREKPRHMTVFPGGGSFARAR
jgi:hypothetical protein